MAAQAKVALSAASTVLGAIGTIQSGRAAAAQAKFRAAQLNRQAERARAEARAGEEEIRRRRARDAGRLRARLAASGIDPGAGSPLLAQETLAADAELEALTARYRGAARASDLDASASGQRLAGRAARQASYFRAGTRLLDGASRLPEPE